MKHPSLGILIVIVLAAAVWWQRERLFHRTCQPGRNSKLVLLFKPFASQSERDRAVSLLGSGKDPERHTDLYVFSEWDIEAVSSVRSLPSVMYADNPIDPCEL
jgi:hypothetical protein